MTTGASQQASVPCLYWCTSKYTCVCVYVCVFVCDQCCLFNIIVFSVAGSASGRVTSASGANSRVQGDSGVCLCLCVCDWCFKIIIDIVSSVAGSASMGVSRR